MSEDIVGIVGTGYLGSGIARSSARAGLTTVAYDVDQARLGPLSDDGIAAERSVAALAGRCDVISIVVLDDRQVREVVGTILEASRPGTHVIVQSTVRPSTVIELAARAAERGLVLFDAPVTGGAEGGASGTLNLIAGGDAVAIARCLPFFDAIGQSVLRVGPVGAGAAAKLVNNLLSITSHMVQIEAMQLVAVYGIDEDTVTRVVAGGGGDSRGIHIWGKFDRQRRTNVWPSFDGMLKKDLGEVLAAAGDQGVVLPMTTVASATLSTKVAERDRVLDERGAWAAAPRCEMCDSELAAPYRDGGVHPECSARRDERHERTVRAYFDCLSRGDHDGLLAVSTADAAHVSEVERNAAVHELVTVCCTGHEAFAEGVALQDGRSGLFLCHASFDERGLIRRIVVHGGA